MAFPRLIRLLPSLPVALILGTASAPALAESSPQNNALWQKYCSATGSGPQRADVIGKPSPNYGDDTVKLAAYRLAQVDTRGFAMYGDFLRPYKSPKPAGQLTVSGKSFSVTQDGHNFLNYLCGEFRDRATLLKDKLEWVATMNKLPPITDRVFINPENKLVPKVDVWRQITVAGYWWFVKNMSLQIWEDKAMVMKLKPVVLGGQNIDPAVPGFSVCETRFIFDYYLAGHNPTGKPMFYKPGTLNDYITALNNYSKSSGQCEPADLTDYYDFRGDANFKPNTPEANAMIWYGKYIVGNCKGFEEARKLSQAPKLAENVVTDEMCRDYFLNPFKRRYQAARSGLATWMLHAEKFDKVWLQIYAGASYPNQSGGTIQHFPHWINDNPASQRPFRFAAKTPVTYPPSFWDTQDIVADTQAWIDGFNPNSSPLVKGDFGFEALAKQHAGTHAVDAALFKWGRLRDVVNTHTWWYSSQWDDGLNNERTRKNQAFSPLVASSYEPSASDHFTKCGYTIACQPDADTRRQWMYVFRIKGENLYNPQKIRDGAAVDFDRAWLDETSFGTAPLAESEHAWDRLGTAVEGEYATILYLHNLTGGGSFPANVSDDAQDLQVE
jgi:hypothetical protein